MPARAESTGREEQAGANPRLPGVVLVSTRPTHVPTATGQGRAAGALTSPPAAAISHPIRWFQTSRPGSGDDGALALPQPHQLGSSSNRKIPVLQTGDPGAIPGGSTRIVRSSQTGPVVQWRRHLAYNQKTMVRFHPGPLERRFSKPPLARCDAGLAARLSISPTRVRFPSASLGFTAAECHERDMVAQLRTERKRKAAGYGWPGRTANACLRSRRCGFESHAFRFNDHTTA